MTGPFPLETCFFLLPRPLPVMFIRRFLRHKTQVNDDDVCQRFISRPYTNGRAIGTVLRLSVVCLRRYVLWVNSAS